jgi:hypothetical protein
MSEIRELYARHVHDRQFLMSVGVGVVLLALSLCINFYAGTYATERTSNFVTDVVLSNTPVFDVDVFFVYGPIVLWALVTVLGVVRPQRAPYILKSIAVFILIRSVFISLTHLGPFPTQVVLDVPTFITKFTFGGDLFFSGHTGLPFLMALLFWNNKKLRCFFIAASVFFGVIVLLGHLHYSIDVLSAFFITYAISHITRWLFPKDYRLFMDSLSSRLFGAGASSGTLQ